MNDEKYDYKAAIKSDILDWLKEHGIGFIDEQERGRIYDQMFVCDSVTGNASGSYTFNTWKAESYLCHNEDLRQECIDEFGINLSDRKSRGAEYWDVSIRCYLLSQVLSEVVEEWNNDHPEPEDDDVDETTPQERIDGILDNLLDMANKPIC